MTDLCRVFLFIYLIIAMIFFPSMIPMEDRYQTKDITGKYIE